MQNMCVIYNLNVVVRLNYSLINNNNLSVISYKFSRLKKKRSINISLAIMLAMKWEQFPLYLLIDNKLFLTFIYVPSIRLYYYQPNRHAFSVLRVFFFYARN